MTASHCTKLQLAATLQHTATHCNTPQHTEWKEGVVREAEDLFAVAVHDRRYQIILRIGCNEIMKYIHIYGAYEW